MFHIDLKTAFVVGIHIVQSNVGELVLRVMLHHRFPNRLKLREKASLFFCVAGLRCGLYARAFVHILADALVHGGILVDQIIVILIVGVEMLKRPIK